MISSCYVFVVDEHEPRICGKYTIQEGVGYFVYGQSWLSRKDAYPLDPINYPLIDTTFQSSAQHGAIGVLSDSAPDSWGRQVHMASHQQQPANEVEWLLVGSGRGAGCLAFSPSRNKIKPFGTPPDFSEVATFIQIADTIEAGIPLDMSNHPKEWVRLLEYGSSMGGAKPKIVVSHEGKEWIAKLNRKTDSIDVVKIEFATRELAVSVGIIPPAMQLHDINGRSVLLIERFDRDALGRRHYLSVHSLLNAGRVREDYSKTTYSYGQVADLSRRMCADPRQIAPEIYRRMVFNALIGNTDDHARNHGFLKNRANNDYLLAPAFDISPQPNSSHVHSLGLGDEGRIAKRSNLISQAKRFLLTKEQAIAEIDRQIKLLANWRAVYEQHNVRELDIRMLEQSFSLVK